MKRPRIVFKKHWSILAIGILVILLVVEARYFIASFHAQYAQGGLRPEYHHHQRLPLVDPSAAHPILTVDSIAPWMTFDYVNVVFHLPASYLKNILGISNPKYPNIRIDRYAKQINMNQQLLLQTIRQYIASYNPQ
jgi:hypothetical protein